MGSGKSTVAEYLCNNYGFTKLSLGEKIHSECMLYNKHDREHLQKYGQAMREIFGQNIWCDYLIKKSKNRNIKKIVIDDGRQLNEYNYFVNLGYLPIGIVTEDNLRLERLQKRVNYPVDPETFNHDTELQAKKCVEMCDIKIHNNGTSGQLFREIEEKLGRYL